MAREAGDNGAALAAFVAVESLRAATDEQERIEALSLLIYSCAGAEVDRMAQSAAAMQGDVVPLLAPLLGSGSMEQRKLAGNALLILCFKHSDNAALVGESMAVEAAIANALASGLHRSELALIANDDDLVRQISVGMLSNVAAFNMRSHARLIECGVVQMAVSVLESSYVCRLRGIPQGELHDKLIAWSVSLLHCLSDNPSNRSTLLGAGAAPQLLRIAQSARVGYFPVSATFAVANLYVHADKCSNSALLSPPPSAVHIPSSVLRQCVEAFPAALRGEVHNGYYFLPHKVALGLRNLLSLSPVSDNPGLWQSTTIATIPTGSLLDVERSFAKLHRQQDAVRDLKATVAYVSKPVVLEAPREAAGTAATTADLNDDTYWAIGVPVDGIRPSLIEAGALHILARSLLSANALYDHHDCGSCAHGGQSLSQHTPDAREVRAAHTFDSQTVIETNATMYELVVGFRSLEMDLLQLQSESGAPDCGLSLLAMVIRPLLQSLCRLAWAKVGQWFPGPQLPLDLVEMVIGACPNTASNAQHHSAIAQEEAATKSSDSDNISMPEDLVDTRNCDGNEHGHFPIDPAPNTARDSWEASELHDAAAKRFVRQRVQEPCPEYWCRTQASYHATKTWI